MISNQMTVITYYQWWRRLVNAYEVKAGMMCLQCKKLCDQTQTVRASAVSYDGALYNLYLLIDNTSSGKLSHCRYPIPLPYPPPSPRLYVSFAPCRFRINVSS